MTLTKKKAHAAKRYELYCDDDDEEDFQVDQEFEDENVGTI